MAGKNSIQFLRGTEAALTGHSTDELLDGQPLYDKTNNWLYVGNDLKNSNSIENRNSISMDFNQDAMTNEEVSEIWSSEPTLVAGCLALGQILLSAPAASGIIATQEWVQANTQTINTALYATKATDSKFSTIQSFGGGSTQSINNSVGTGVSVFIGDDIKVGSNGSYASLLKSGLKVETITGTTTYSTSITRVSTSASGVTTTTALSFPATGGILATEAFVRDAITNAFEFDPSTGTLNISIAT